MAQTFDQSYAESGRQSELDALRASGQYDAARSAWESGGGTANRMTPLNLSQVPSTQGFIQGQFAGEDVALRELVSQMRAREQPLDIYSRLETQAGVPELRGASRSLSQEIGSLEDAIYGKETQVAGRTRESLMTEAQRGRLVEAEREPLRENLTRLGTSLGRITTRIGEELQGIATKVGLAVQGQEMALEPAKLVYTTLIDRNARSLTGFTADRETQLTQLIENWQRGNTIADQDWALMNQLAVEEREYTRGLQQLAATQGVTITGNETATQLLDLIGGAYGESIAWERAYKTRESSGDGIALNLGTTPTEAKPTTVPAGTSPYASNEDAWAEFGLPSYTAGSSATLNYQGF